MSNRNFSQHVQNVGRLDELRLKVNEIMQSSQVNDCSGLLSLNDILMKDDAGHIVSSPEEYLMVSSTQENRNEEQEGKDRSIIVTRMKIIFNGEESQLMTFTDTTIHKRLEQ